MGASQHWFVLLEALLGIKTGNGRHVGAWQGAFCPGGGSAWASFGQGPAMQQLGRKTLDTSPGRSNFLPRTDTCCRHAAQFCCLA